MVRHLVGCSFALAAVAAAQAPPAPTSTSYHFGRVTQGATVTHQFMVARPRASAPVQVRRVDLTGPGMTARFKPAADVGPPVSIVISWNTSKVEGQVEAQAIVQWTDPALPATTLTLAGVVVPPIELQPLGAAFFSVFTDERAEQVIRVINHESRPLIVRRIEPAGSHFAATVRPAEPGRRYDVRITVPAGQAPGRFQEQLRIHTDSPIRPVIEVPVNVLVKADVYVNPEQIDFGDLSATAIRGPRAGGLTQTVLVKRRQGPFEIRQATTDVPGLTIAVSPGGSQSTHQVDVRLAADALAPRSLTGTIRLLTSDPRFPRIVIPVRGRIR